MIATEICHLKKTEALYKTGPVRGIVIVYMKGKKPSLQVSSQHFPGFYGGGGGGWV
jgi:hypothetical protein